MSIGENIKRLRESRGLTQSELGKIAGVTDKAVSTWEADLKVPRMGAIQKMADYFQIPKSVILDGEVIPTAGQLAKIAKILGVSVSDLIGPNDWQDIDVSDAFTDKDEPDGKCNQLFDDPPPRKYQVVVGMMRAYKELSTGKKADFSDVPEEDRAKVKAAYEFTLSISNLSESEFEQLLEFAQFLDSKKHPKGQ